MDESDSFFQKPLFKKLAWFGVFLLFYLCIELYIRTIAPGIDQILAQPVSGSPAEVPAAVTGTNSALNILVENIPMLFWDAGICLTGLFVWMVFFAQFVLPVNTLKDRSKVVKRLINYFLGSHGPAIFIENGYTYASVGENNLKGPGVIWLDSASAAVLRTTGRFTRTIGPGVHFTRANEYIAATADLHTLTQTIGPLETDEPFKIPDKGMKTENENRANSTPEEEKKKSERVRAARERAEATTAMTRDGFPVAACISVSFRIRSIPGEGNTRFGFNPENTLAAIRDSMIREVNLDHPVWNTLPARMAADIWREYLGKFRVTELFGKGGRSELNTLQYINAMMRKRLTCAHVEQLDAYGKVVLENPANDVQYQRLLSDKKWEAAEALLYKISSTEFSTLSEMGLEIKNVFIKKIFLAPDVEEQLINQWTGLWLINAQKEREQVEIERTIRQNAGLEKGLKEFSLSASRDVARQAPTVPAHALELLINASTQEIKSKPGLFKYLHNRLPDLADILIWLKNKQGPAA